MRSLLLMAPLMLLAAPVSAQQAQAPAPDPTQTTQDVAAAHPAAKQKKICRTDADTGSRIQSSTCHTHDEWAAIDKANQENAMGVEHRLDNAQRQNVGPGADLQGGMASGPH